MHQTSRFIVSSPSASRSLVTIKTKAADLVSVVVDVVDVIVVVVVAAVIVVVDVVVVVFLAKQRQKINTSRSSRVAGAALTRCSTVWCSCRNGINTEPKAASLLHLSVDIIIAHVLPFILIRCLDHAASAVRVTLVSN